MTAGQASFIIEVILVLVLLAVVGIGMSARLSGVLLDSRNRYSLPQLAAVLWAVLLVAGVLAAGLANLARSASDPLALKIPQEVFEAAGLSATALVGTPIVRAVKRGNSQPTDLMGPDKQPVTDKQLVGSIVQNTKPDSATWMDLFQGEESGNHDRPDLSRIQLFYFTILAVGIYGAQLFAALGSSTPATFPQLDQGLLGLLLLSNGTSLVYQAAPHKGAADDAP
jgi:hypothetical protein